MTKPYFITGTNTDCGKTYVVTQLLNSLNKNMSTALGIKPIASGCILDAGQLRSEDVMQLQAANPLFPEAINRWCYAEPIAPHLAAKKQQEEIGARDVQQFCEGFLHKGFDYLLVEGAGGLLVPLNDDETWLDLLKLSNMPVILVVGLTLGCINHALLTDAVLHANHIPCKGFIANQVDVDCLEVDNIISTLIRKMHMPHLATLPYCGILPDFINML